MKNSELGSRGLGQGVLKKNQGTTASFITNTPVLHYSGIVLPSQPLGLTGILRRLLALMAGDCATTQHEPRAHITVCRVSYHLDDFCALVENESRCHSPRHFVSVEL